jgi:hypothetical protein
MRSTDVFKGAFLKADDLQNKSIKATIEDVRMEDIGEDRRAVVHFVGKEKGLVLNKTNWSILEEVCGSGDSDDWAGYTITMHVVKVDYQGKRVPAIRVSDERGATVAPVRASRPAVDDAPAGDVTDDDIPF